MDYEGKPGRVTCHSVCAMLSLRCILDVQLGWLNIQVCKRL
jgi:hypothetical protein